MRKIILLCAFLFLSVSFVFSQVNIFPTNTPPNNVGIGTTSPNGALAIQRDPTVTGNEIYFTGQSGANQNSNSLRLNFVGYAQTAGFGIQALNTNGYGTKDLVFYAHDLNKHADYTSYDEIVRFKSNGMVGIGTSSPAATLQVIGNAIIGQNVAGSNNAKIDITSGGYSQDSRIDFGYYTTFDASVWNVGRWGADGSFRISDFSSGSEANRFLINTAGKVGIGTSAPAAGALLDVNGLTYSRQMYVGTPDGSTVGNMGTNLLAVNGTAVFVKAKVAIYGPTTWPDYVFSPTYKLTPLDSLEQFIHVNKHLPEVPTADDVQKNGVDLGDNQALLLKKVEELTLIVIEQNKRIEKLEEISQTTKEK
jgi:hypothetical protein